MIGLELQQLLANVSGPIHLAVHPKRWQLALSRLILLARSRKGRWPVGLLSWAIGVSVGVGSMHLLGDIAGHGLLPVLQQARIPALHALAILAAGASALFAVALHAGDELSRRELESGALLQLSREGVAATVRGATLYYDWDHVRVHVCALGVLFEMPRGAFHLLPREVWTWHSLGGDAAGSETASQGERLSFSSTPNAGDGASTRSARSLPNALRPRSVIRAVAKKGLRSGAANPWRAAGICSA